MAKNDSADAPGEADEQLKKRARRRLVGAAALVMFAVIVLPMVMDREPRSASPEIQVRIPSQDAPAFDGRLSPPKADKAVASSEKAAPPVESSKKPDMPPDVVPSTEEKPRAVAAKAEKVEPKPESSPEQKPVPAKIEPKPDAKLAAAAGKKADAAESSRAAAALGGSGNEQWVVQLGAYQEPGRVKLLLAKIKELGLPVYTEKVDTPQGPRTRVRAGPFSTREAALKAQNRVKIIGVDGPVAAK